MPEIEELERLVDQSNRNLMALASNDQDEPEAQETEAEPEWDSRSGVAFDQSLRAVEPPYQQTKDRERRADQISEEAVALLDSLPGPKGYGPPEPLDPNSILQAGFHAEDLQIEVFDSGTQTVITVTKFPQVTFASSTSIQSTDPDLVEKYKTSAEKAVQTAEELIREAEAEAVGGKAGMEIRNLLKTRDLIHKEIGRVEEELQEARDQQTVTWETDVTDVKALKEAERKVVALNSHLKGLQGQEQEVTARLDAKRESLQAILETKVAPVRERILATCQETKRRTIERLAQLVLEEGRQWYVSDQVEKEVSNQWSMMNRSANVQTVDTFPTR
jgi:hypothetical protein